MQISLCMIVKNEQRALPALLESLRSRFEDIIVADDASTDGTRRVLQQYGVHALVRDHAGERPGEDVMRNRCLELAACPWVLVLDADERISAADLDRLCRMEPEDGVDGYFLRWNTHVHGNVIEDYKLALFRREARFTSSIHSNLQPDFRRRGFHAGWSDAACIEHHPDPARAALKSRTYEARLLRGIAKHPDWIRYHWFLGYGCFRQRRTPEALRHLEIAATSDSSLFPVESLNARMVRAEILSRLGRRTQVKRELAQAQHHWQQMRDDFEVRVNFRLARWLQAAARQNQRGAEPLRAYPFPY